MDHKRRKNNNPPDVNQLERVLKLKFSLVLIIVFWMLGACRAQVTESWQGTQSEPLSQLKPSSTSTPQSLMMPTSTREATKILELPSSTLDGGDRIAQTETATLQPTSIQIVTVSPTSTNQPSPFVPSATLDSAYPGPIQEPPASSNQPAYPGPQPIQEGSSAYPGYPASSSGIFSGGEQANPTVAPTQIQVIQTPTPSPSFRSTDRIQLPTLTPFPTGESGVFSPLNLPPVGSNLTIKIWHSLESPKLSALEDIIRAFQQTFPQVSFELTYIPLDDLKQSYTAAVYKRSGPDLLLGPSEWSAELYDLGLVADLGGYYPEQFWEKIVPVALETGQYRQAQISLPVTMSGVVLYRNSKIILKASSDYASMAEKAKTATRSGIVGSYFDLDPLFSMAHLDGLGGNWQDSSGKPVFNQRNYASGLAWIKMLLDFDRMGAVELNTSRDLSLFRQSKVGLIIDGTWNIDALSLALGVENLAVDPWPTYGSGKMSGYVFTQGFYLSSETAAELDANLMASLQFIGAVVSPQSQQRLVEESISLPVLKDFQVPDRLKNQAVVALEGGTAFPPVLQGKRFEVYRSALYTAIGQTFGFQQNIKVPGLESLQNAYGAIVDWFDR